MNVPFLSHRARETPPLVFDQTRAADSGPREPRLSCRGVWCGVWRGAVTLMLGCLVLVRGLSHSTAVAQDDWDIVRRPAGANRPSGVSRPGRGTRPSGPMRTGGRDTAGTTAPSGEGPPRDARDVARERMIARYTSVLESDPSADFALSRLAELYRERDGSLEGFIASLESRRAADASAFTPRVILGRLFVLAGRHADAESVLREALTLRPDDAAALATLARALVAGGRAADARPLLVRAIDRARDDSTRQDLARALGELAMDAGDWDAAREAFERIVPPRGASVYLATEYARALSARGEHARAAAEYERVLQRLGGDARVSGPLLRDLGKALLDAGDLAGAERALRRALRASGSSPSLRRELWEQLAETRRRAGRLDALVLELRGDRSAEALAVRAVLEDELGNEAGALAAYRALLARSPRDTDVRLRLVQLLARSGRLTEAVEEYRALVRAVPDEARFVAELAQLLLQLGRREEALRELDAASRRLPRSARHHRVLAEVFARWGESERAAREVALLARLEPDDPAHLIALGTQQLEAGDAAASRATWRRVLAVERDRARALVLLGGVYADHDMLEDALEAYAEAARLQPTDVEAQRGLASTLERAGRAREAAAAWQQVLERSTDRESRREARQRVVAIWTRTGEMARRLPELERAFRGQPPDLEAGRSLAEAYLRASPPRTAEAERVLERVTELERGDVESLLALERVRVSRGDLAGAIAALERLVEADARRAGPYLTRMAEHALALYRDEDAIRYARRAVERMPDDAAAHARLASLHRARQDVDAAIAAYRRAIELDPRAHAAYFDLAELYLASGQMREAARLYQRLFTSSADDDLVMRAGRAALQIHIGEGTLEQLELELLPLALASATRPVFRRLLVEVYDAEVAALAAAARGDAEGATKAREALARIGRRALKPLLEALVDPDPAQRRIAVDVLAVVGNANAAAALVAVAEAQGDVVLRARALLAAGAVGDASLLPRLSTMASGPEARLRDAAAWAIARIGGRAALPLLRALLGHGDPAVRSAAALGFGQFVAAPRGAGAGAPPVVGAPPEAGIRDALERLLARDPSEEVQAAAALALAVLGREESVPVLVAALSARGALTRRAAAVALGGRRDSLASRALWSALFGRDPALRDAAAAALARPRRPFDVLPVPRAPLSMRGYVARLVDEATAFEPGPVDFSPHGDALVEAAADALAGPVEQVTAVLAALASGPPSRLSLGPLVETLDAWPEPSRQAGLEALRALGRALLPRLLVTAAHPEPAVRALAASVLGRIDEEDAVAALAAACGDPEPRVRRAALRAAGPRHAAAVASVAARLLAGAMGTSRARVAPEATGNGLPEGAAADWVLRVEAAAALGRMGAWGATAVLAAALAADPSAFVRQAAADALAATARAAASEPSVGPSGRPDPAREEAAMREAAALREVALANALARDAEPRVRAAAARALRESGGRAGAVLVDAAAAADPALRALLAEPAGDVPDSGPHSQPRRKAIR
jgi:tetratricopeptide (TPR) repeat protein